MVTVAISLERPALNLITVIDQLKKLDTNKDGTLTVDEVPLRLRPIFKQLDFNSDDKLTADEAREAIQKRRQ